MKGKKAKKVSDRPVMVLGSPIPPSTPGKERMSLALLKAKLGGTAEYYGSLSYFFFLGKDVIEARKTEYFCSCI